MTFRLMACMTLALTVFVSSAVAQEEGGRQRGQRGQGGPGGGMGFGMRQGPSGASSIFRMLGTAEVRKEVGVTDEVYETVSKQMTEINEKLRNRDLSEEDRKKLGEEANTKAQEIMDEILTPAKQKRLKGLYAQQSQARAVLNTVIAKEISLPDDKRTEIEKALTELTEKNMESFRQGGAQGGGAGGFQEIMAKAQEEASKLVDSKLSADQKKALEELKGEKFKFPERNFGGGQGGRGGQGGGAPGGRPRGDGN
jgi:hypothetical protein